MVGGLQICIKFGLHLFVCLCVCHVFFMFCDIHRHIDILDLEERIDPTNLKCKKCQESKKNKR